MSDPNPNPPGAVTPDKPTTQAATATTPAPARPAPARPAAKPKVPERRGFLVSLFTSWIVLAWTTFCASMALMTLGTVRFLFPNVLTEPPSSFKAGLPDTFEEGKVNNDFKDKNAWIVKNGGVLYALSTTCTHLGCTPNWLEREQKFKCPCHGSGFYISGINFEGPAPRPLERWAVRIGDDGQVVVDKSRKFQFERGEWDNPESFIKV
jgi:cytochrome b6-f complex iron-sulfur subunit